MAAQWGAAALTHSAEDYSCFCQEKIKLPLPLGLSLPAPGFVPAEQSWGKSPGSMDHPQHWMSHSGAPDRKFPSSSPMVLKVFCNEITGRQQYPGAGMEFEPMAFWLGGETIPNWAKVTHTYFAFKVFRELCHDLKTLSLCGTNHRAGKSWGSLFTANFSQWIVYNLLQNT